MMNIKPIEELELERQNTPERWRSCCFGDINKNAMVFFTQVVVLFFFLCFCCSQLIRLETCESQQLYTSLVTLVLGILCPNPKIKH